MHSREDRDQIESLWRGLCAELCRRGADRHTAEDITQEAWLISLRKRPADPGRFWAWMRVVSDRLLTRSRSREALRVRKEWFASTPVDETARLAGDGPAETSTLAGYVEALPEPYRTVLRLRYFEAHEVSEIAAMLGISTALVHTRLHRGVEHLRRRLEHRRDPGLSLGLAWIRWRVRLDGGFQSWRLLGASLALACTFIAWSAWVLGPPRPAARELERVASSAPLVVPRTSLAPPPSARVEGPRTALDPVSVAAPRFAGMVRTPQGKPVAGAVVHAAMADGSDESTVVTDEQGRFTLVVKRELIWASHPQWLDSPRCYAPSIQRIEDVGLFLAPTRGRALVQVVDHEDSPVADALVWLTRTGRPRLRGTEHGTLELDGPLPAGTTDAEGRVWLLFPEEAGIEISVEAGVGWWSQRVATPGDGDRFLIELPAPIPLSGTLRSESGHPLWDAKVEASQLDGRVCRVARTDIDGHFRIDGLAPGDFSLRALEALPGLSSARYDGRIEPGFPELRLVAGEEGNLLGRALAQGRPIQDALVRLGMNSHVRGEAPRRTTFTDDRGFFVFQGRPGNMHWLEITPPGARWPAVRASQMRPGSGEELYLLPLESDVLAPVELELVTTVAPHLVELRRVSPALSAVAALEGGAARYRFGPLPRGRYEVHAWHSQLGSCQLGEIKHDPRAPSLHVLHTPDVATLVIEVDLPAGLSNEGLEVSLEAEVFAADLLEDFGLSGAVRHLAGDPARRVYAERVYSGVHDYCVRGPGLADSWETVTVAPGSVTRVLSTPCRGVETTLMFQSEFSPPQGVTRNLGLRQSEVLRLDVIMPARERQFDFTREDLRRVEGGFELELSLPESTLEIHATTYDPTFSASFLPRRGSYIPPPDELDPTRRHMRIVIPLHRESP